MGKMLVAGIANIETTVNIGEFPISYVPISYPFFGVNSVAAGNGLNIAKALTVLGDDVNLLSLSARDVMSSTVTDWLKHNEISSEYVLENLRETPQSVVLYDDKGKRQIYCDLKDVQHAEYDIKIFKKALEDCSFAVLCNTNFTRPFLKITKDAGKKIATNVHELSDIYDEYNSEFMRNADILFLSGDHIEGSEFDFVKALEAEYHNEIIIVGLGEKGALLYSKKDDFIGKFPSVKTRKIVNTVGAGDSLFSAFLHFYNKTEEPFYSIKNALLFASYKIGTSNASNGFLTEEQLEKFYPIIWK